MLDSVVLLDAVAHQLPGHALGAEEVDLGVRDHDGCIGRAELHDCLLVLIATALAGALRRMRLHARRLPKGRSAIQDTYARGLRLPL